MNDFSTDVSKKELGQHWLDDRPTLQTICDMASVSDQDTVLEIGPGQGSLTQLLIQVAKQVVAVEFDDSLIINLGKRFANVSNLELVNQDIRRFDLNRLPTDYKAVANIPYYLTSYLIRLLSQAANPPRVAVLLIQQEVAQRLAAGPGRLSILGVIAQAYWDISLGPLVPAAMFKPPPKVDSQTVKMTRKTTPAIPKGMEKEFLQTVKVGFSQKRKTLINSFSGGFHIDKDKARVLIGSIGVPESARPQELSLRQWSELTRAITPYLPPQDKML